MCAAAVHAGEQVRGETGLVPVTQGCTVQLPTWKTLFMMNFWLLGQCRNAIHPLYMMVIEQPHRIFLRPVASCSSCP